MRGGFGLVTGVSTGTAIITAVSEGRSATARVAVSKRWPDKINGYLNHIDADYKACVDACGAAV